VFLIPTLELGSREDLIETGIENCFETGLLNRGEGERT